MSTITIEMPGEVPETVIEQLATPEGMARARAALLAAFPELAHTVPLDTRTPREKALDDYRAEQKAIWRARDEKLRQGVIEGRKLKEQAA